MRATPPSEAARTRALVLVGHGSQKSGHSARPVYAHAARIRRLGIFDEVLEAFWKEEPALHDALDLVEADEAVVVPLFLAEGYFTRTVVPRELRSHGRGMRAPAVRYASPVGAHPGMAEIVLRRARTAVPTAMRSNVTLLIVGHGTERAAASGGTVYTLRDRLRGACEFAAVECAFLDEPPFVTPVLERIGGATVVVPYFLADGWHAGITLPRDIGADDDAQRTQRLWYTEPVGTDRAIARIALACAAQVCEAGVLPRRRSAPATRARLAFIERVDAHAGEYVALLELLVRRIASGYEIRHRADADVPAAQLQRHTRAHAALALARATAAGVHRAHRSAPGLRRGWVLHVAGEECVWRALSWFYPTALLRRFELTTGTLRAGSFRCTAERQSGMNAVAKTLGDDALHHVIRQCCAPGRCLRTPLWSAGDVPAAALLDRTAAPAGGIVPCVEPCSVFIARAVAAAGAQQA